MSTRRNMLRSIAGFFGLGFLCKADSLSAREQFRSDIAGIAFDSQDAPARMTYRRHVFFVDKITECGTTNGVLVQISARLEKAAASNQYNVSCRQLLQVRDGQLKVVRYTYRGVIFGSNDNPLEEINRICPQHNGFHRSLIDWNREGSGFATTFDVIDTEAT